ncbi:hypothetical protein KQ874_03340 [Mycoplasma sp. ES3157-GEN-MYC]|uniref:Uncharacterized protein n=1 Tax=Mycoplasma miroungigenitalium TaxID=754515 RepID=A0A6M4JGM1_9MOLU|nr:hypothetical protein [Mycoplasma miroungigenitalium]MBU4690711.1 hypothetical protein [Mycoplasma miroungigenitalium]MBU4691980.1 hypothetical protein [Mycoplasma miroungigenitalium]QJR43831.1 hypothetical protein HLA87_03535 [Mycoplasma miroungigenitalium]
MKQKFKLIIGTTSAFAPIMALAASCSQTQNSKPEPKPNTQQDSELTETQKVKKIFAEFIEIINEIKQNFGSNQEQFLSKNTNFSEFSNKFSLLTNENNSESISSLIKKFSDITTVGNYILTEDEYANWLESDKELYKEWFTTNAGVELVKNSLGIIDDAKIQIQTNTKKIALENNANSIWAFQDYLNDLGNKNFEDKTIQEKLTKLKNFFSDYIYNAEKWNEDQHDSLHDEHNHGSDNHTHTHSHATLNISLNSIRQNKEFIHEFVEVIGLRKDFEKLTNENKRQYWLTNLFDKIKFDKDKLLKIADDAEQELEQHRKLAIKALDKIKEIENIINPN